jgi:hypothetical protein
MGALSCERDVGRKERFFGMNYKRRRARNRRAGCKLCKYWKVNGFKTEHRGGERFSDHRRRAASLADARDCAQ